MKKFMEDIHVRISTGLNSTSQLATSFKNTPSDEFTSLLKSWDKASMIRKWISSTKLEISERIEKEEAEKFKQEFNNAHPS